MWLRRTFQRMAVQSVEVLRRKRPLRDQLRDVIVCVCPANVRATPRVSKSQITTASIHIKQASKQVISQSTQTSGQVRTAPVVAADSKQCPTTIERTHNRKPVFELALDCLRVVLRSRVWRTFAQGHEWMAGNRALGAGTNPGAQGSWARKKKNN